MLFKTLKEAQLQARLSKDAVKTASLTTLIGEITTRAKNDGSRDVIDGDVVTVVTKFINGQNTLIDAATKINDQARIDAANAEIELYKTFLPTPKDQMTKEALDAELKQLIDGRLLGEGGVKPKMGVVLADLKILHEGEYDPKLAAQLVKAQLDAIPGK